MSHKIRTALRGRTGWTVLVGLTLAATALLLTLRAPDTGAADIPDRLVYRGLLTSQDGAPARDGTYAVRLAFFDHATAGAELCRWTQTTVPVRAGRFQVEVGGTVGSGTCPSVQAMLRGTSGIWVETAIQDTDGSFLALRPRLPVGATFRAQHAEYAEHAGDRLALELVPSGMVAMFRRECPEGWDPVPEMNGRIPRGAPVAGGTGGSETTAAAGDHNHTLGNAGSHTHGSSHDGNHTHATGYCEQPGTNQGLRCDGWAGVAGPACERFSNWAGDGGGHSHGSSAAGDHSHSVTTTGAHSHSARPPSATVVICRKR
jgi:hypothetical protein